MAAQSKKKPRRSKSADSSGAENSSSPWKKPLRPIEQSLLDVADEICGERIVVVSNAGAQAAAEIAQKNPDSRVV
ncbi:MAG: hypothetical protein O2983_05530, partial [Planctomycetota bacterium]|nr:hypothetical protein [Planctomycetota bacterium]